MAAAYGAWEALGLPSVEAQEPAVEKASSAQPVPDRKQYDVVVAGAGIAGVAAALALARGGHRTALVERTIQTGGLATGGYVTWFSSLCDQRGHQVIHGIPEELMRLSTHLWPGYIYGGWEDKNARDPKSHANFSAHFAPAAFALSMEELLLKEKVDLWYDTRVCAAEKAGETITAVEVENKSGRGRFAARAFVDATGDADLAFQAGAPCEEGVSLPISLGAEASLENAKRAVTGKTARSLNAYGGAGAHGRRRRQHKGTRAETINQFLFDSRDLMRAHYRKLQADLPGGASAVYPLVLPSLPQMRTARKIVGVGTFHSDNQGKPVNDSIGLIGDWFPRFAGQVYEIPYAALLPQQVKNLIVGGRCISTGGRRGWEVSRVIGAAAHTGQLAGIAASIALHQRVAMPDLDVSAIQAELDRLKIPYRFAQAIPGFSAG
jgi:hypothetical protein